jgi:hypothetical protein
VVRLRLTSPRSRLHRSVDLSLELPDRPALFGREATSWRRR